MSSRMRAAARRLYHWLPMPLAVKWGLRARLHPLVHALQRDASVRGLVRGLSAVWTKRGVTLGPVDE